jgi:septum site-determining protein MinC
VTAVTSPRRTIRFRARSIQTMVLAPEPPLAGWWTEFDTWLSRSPGFFRGRPVILDFSALETSKRDVTEFVTALYERGIRVMGFEGVDPTYLDPVMAPILSGPAPHERTLNVVDLAEHQSFERRAKPNTLVVENHVRSGQCIGHPEGDVVILGSVASGAEVIAGGSIHIYGTLRGRAIAGCESASARIFCRKLEAELLSIDGLYMTADQMGANLRGRPVQIWLDRDKTMMMTALD